MGGQDLHHRRAPGAVVLAHLPHERFAAGKGRHACALNEVRRAGVAALRVGVHLLLDARRSDHPAKPPAGHRVRFRESVDDDDGVFRGGEGEERGSDLALEHVPVIDLVRDDRDSSLPAEVEEPTLLLARHHPARRVGRAVDEDGRGVRAHRLEHVVELEPPPARVEPLADEVEAPPGHLERAVDVRPRGTHDDPVTARAERHPGRHVDAEHGGAGNDDAPDREVDAVEPIEVGLDRLAQVHPSGRMIVEGAALVERSFRRVPDELRGDRVAFPEPEGDDRGVRDPRKRDGGDPVLLESLEFVAQHARRFPAIANGEL